MDVACRMGTPVYVGQVMGELMKIASHNWPYLLAGAFCEKARDIIALMSTYNRESARYATDAMLRLIILRHRSLIQSLLSCSKVPS